MRNWRIPLFFLLLQLVVVLPLTAFVAITFVGITWGVSLFIAPFLIPLLSMALMILLLVFVNNKVWQQGLRLGLITSFVFWMVTWIVAPQIPWIQQRVPFPRSKDFERNVGRVAQATHSKLNWMNADKAELVTATGETLNLQDGINAVCFNWRISERSVPKNNPKAVLHFIAERGLVFLNDEGQRALLDAIRARQINWHGSGYLEMKVGVKDNEILSCNPGDNNIGICIKKPYLNMSKNY